MNKSVRSKIDLNTIRMVFTCLAFALVISGVLLLSLSIAVYKDLLPLKFLGLLILVIHAISSTICSAVSQRILDKKNIINAMVVVAAYIATIAFVCVVICDGAAGYWLQTILACFTGAFCGYWVGNYRIRSRTKRRTKR